MLDIKLIREDSESVKKNLSRRHDPAILKSLDELIEKDSEWRGNLKKLEELRCKRNTVSFEVAKAKKEGKPADELIKEMKGIPEKIATLDERNKELRASVDALLLNIPNLLHESVPVGKDDTENKVVKDVKPSHKFSFKPKDHEELLKGLNLLDTDRAAKVAGAGFYYLKGQLAMLDNAIQRFAIDFLVKRGYTLILPPYMLNRKPYEGVTSLADFENVMYRIEGQDLYMIATSEHPMAAMFMDETLLASELPIKFTGVSPCFRREIGTHGKYTKGLFRVHQFNKIEQFIFCRPEESWKYHEELQQNSEKLYELLGIPFHVVNVCTGDIGSIAAKKYDIEALMVDGQHREVGSNSNCTDYQARRLNIKYREKEGQPPAGFVHTLNNTALATSRVMVNLVEWNQQEDGTIKIPKVLQPYMNGAEIMGKL